MRHTITRAGLAEGNSQRGEGCIIELLNLKKANTIVLKNFVAANKRAL